MISYKKSITRRVTNSVGLMIIGLFLINSYACRLSTEPNQSKQIIHVQITKDPIKLNPILKASSYSRMISQYIMPQMCDYNPFSLEYEAILLDKVPVSQPITEGKYKGLHSVKMKIKSDATWDNGSSITGKDYLFTIKTAKHPLVKNTSWKVLLEHVKDIIIDQDNEQHFEVIIEDNYYLATDMVSSVQLFPQYIYDPMNSMDKISITELNNLNTIEQRITSDSSLVHFAKTFNSVEFYKNNISSFGPYRLEEWESDQYVRLVKKENYWAKHDKNIYLQQVPDEIFFHIIPDEVNAISQLKNGLINVITKVSPEGYNRLSNDLESKKKFDFNSLTGMKRAMIGFNHRSIHLSDPNIRSAILQSVDVEALINIIEYGYAKRLKSDFNSAKKSYNEKIPYTEYSPEKAKLSLKKSGWIDNDNDGYVDKIIDGVRTNLTLEYLCSTSAKSQKIAALIKEQVKHSGILFEIKSKPFRKIRNQNLKNHNFDMLMLTRSGNVPLPDPYLMWHSDNLDSGESNYFGYKNAKADKIMESIRTSHNKEQQIMAYHQLQQLMFDEYAYIPLYELNNQLITDNRIDTRLFTINPGYLINTFKLNLK